MELCLYDRLDSWFVRIFFPRGVQSNSCTHINSPTVTILVPCVRFHCTLPFCLAATTFELFFSPTCFSSAQQLSRFRPYLSHPMLKMRRKSQTSRWIKKKKIRRMCPRHFVFSPFSQRNRRDAGKWLITGVFLDLIWLGSGEILRSAPAVHDGERKSEREWS